MTLARPASGRATNGEQKLIFDLQNGDAVKSAADNALAKDPKPGSLQKAWMNE